MSKQLVGVACGLAISVACSSGAPQGIPGSAGQTAAPTAAPASQASPNAESASGAPANVRSASGAGAASASGANAQSAPPTPRFQEVTVPAGTTMHLRLDTAVSSDKSQPEDPVRAKLTQAIVIDGATVVPSGAEAIGSVLEAKRSGRVSGRASVAFRFDRLRSRDESYTIRTARIAREAEATKGEDAKKIGIGAGAGTLIGAIAGGKKGAAIGAGVGAGTGTGVVLATRGKEIHLARGTAVKATLEEPLKVQVPID